MKYLLQSGCTVFHNNGTTINLASLLFFYWLHMCFIWDIIFLFVPPHHQHNTIYRFRYIQDWLDYSFPIVVFGFIWLLIESVRHYDRRWWQVLNILITAYQIESDKAFDLLAVLNFFARRLFSMLTLQENADFLTPKWRRSGVGNCNYLRRVYVLHGVNKTPVGK